jgi:hypothetical protein
MSLRASTSPVIEEDGAQQVSLLAGSLTLSEAVEPRGHRSKKSEPSVPTSSEPGSQKAEMIVETAVKPAISAALARKVSSSLPHVNTTVDQPALPRSVSDDEDPKSSSVRSSQVSFKMTSSATGSVKGPESQGKERPDKTAESRRVRPGSAAATEWDRIQQLRADNWSLRSRIREMRNNLRELQRAKSDADDILFRRLTVHGLGFGKESLQLMGQKTLDELMHDCQAARDAYGPLEDDCNELEDQLSGKEFELDRLEEEFYKRRPEDITVPSDRPLTPVGIQNAENYPSSVGYPDEEDEVSEFHPLVSRYLSKLGDLDILQERLVDHLDEKRCLEEERDRRSRFGLSLDPEDSQWLDNALNGQEDLTDKIRTLQEDLEVMKANCLDQGLVDQDGEPISFQRREQQSFDGEADVDPRGHISEYVRFPILLPHPGIAKPDQKPDSTRRIGPLTRADMRTMKMLLSSAETYPKTSRINEWILDQLRGSALDVNLLARTFQAMSGILSILDERWQIAVLRVWFRDSTMRNADGGLREYTDSMTTQAPAISNPSDRIKSLERRPPGKVVPFNERFSQVSTSELDYDEVEIVDVPTRRRDRSVVEPTEEIFSMF